MRSLQDETEFWVGPENELDPSCVEDVPRRPIHELSPIKTIALRRTNASYLGAICIAYDEQMPTKEQVSVRLDSTCLKLLEDLEPVYGNSKSEVARFLLIEGLERKHGLDLMREKKAIR